MMGMISDMRYNKLPIWDNKSRQKVLCRFLELYEIYVTNIARSSRHSQPKKNAIACDAREQINRILHRVSRSVQDSGINPVLDWVSRAVGIQARVDLFENLFLLDEFDIPPVQVKDRVERAIGVFEEDQFRAWIRTFNPFYWLARLLDYITSIPFRILGKAGFSRQHAEASAIGKLVKLFVSVLTLTGTIIAILKNLDYLDKTVEFLKEM
jgi:hypothetical protein